MGIPHARHREFNVALERRAVNLPDRNLIFNPAFKSFRTEGYVFRQKARLAHIGHHAAVRLPLHADFSLHRLKWNRVARNVAPLKRKAPDAARTVAALLDFIAVAVEDAVAKRFAFLLRRVEQKQLIRADAESPVRQTAHKLRSYLYRFRHAVEDDEVVPGPLHLGEM